MASVTANWESHDPHIASTSPDGTVTARSNGATTVVVRVEPLADTIAVTVMQRPAAVLLTPDSVHFQALGDTTTLLAAVVDAGGSSIPGQVTTWAVDDPAIADVDAGGLLTARATGETQVTASYDSLLSTVPVHVEQVPVSLDVTPDSVRFTSVGEAQPLTVKVLDARGNDVPAAAPTWIIANPDIVSVTGEGLIEAVGNGTTTVTATVATLSVTVFVRVEQVPAAISVEPSSVTLISTGATTTLDGSVTDALGSKIEGLSVDWTSAAPAVADVNSLGQVTAGINGSTTLTVSRGTLSSFVPVLVAIPFEAGHVTHLAASFEDDPTSWTGRHGGASDAEFVLDPLTEGNHVVRFTRTVAHGDLFSPAVAVFPDSTYTLTFRYLGLPVEGSVPDNYGGFIGIADEKPGSHAWLAGTVIDSGATVHLIDDGSWHTYTVTFQPSVYFFTADFMIHVMIEDWEESGFAAKDAYFDDIVIFGPPR